MSTKLTNKNKNILLVLIFILVLNILLMVFTVAFNNTTNRSYDKDNNFIITPHWEEIANGLYFTTTTFSTVGYGDLSPIQWWSKCIISIEQIIIIYLSIDAFSTYVDIKLTS